MSRHLRAVGRVVYLCAATLALAGLMGCDKSSPTAPTPVPCAYTLSSPNQSFTADGGPGVLTISTDARCSWTVAGATDWVTLQSPQTGTGAASINFTVLPNPDGATREKTLSVASLPFTISQAGRVPCAFSISPEQQRVSADGASGEVKVSAAPGCGWTARSNASWITVTSGAQGLGAGVVAYAVAPNDTTNDRTGTMLIANRTFTVDQDYEAPPAPTDCVYSVAPVDFAPCMPAGTLQAEVTTKPGCAWTAEPNTSWLRIPSGRSGTGSELITIEFSDNYDAPRDGLVMVRWPTPTAGQNLRVAQAGCLYSVTPSSFSFTSSGGSGTFDVTQQSVPNTCGGPTQDRCVWTARSSVSWITVTTSMPRSGDGAVSFTVVANAGTASRVGTITVRDKVVTVTQAGS